MNEKALKTLEYDKIISKLTEYAQTPLGTQKCRELLPMDRIDEIRSAFPMELAEAKKLLAARNDYLASAKREGERCLLHFEAADFACACCVNGQVVGTHEGAYLPFTFDITEALNPSGDGPSAALDAGDRAEMVVAVAVRDPSDEGTQLRGKQRLERGGIWYSAQSGLWQPVWMEVVPARRIERLALHPDGVTGRLVADVDVRGDGGLVRLYVSDGAGAQVGSVAVPAEAGAAVRAKKVTTKNMMKALFFMEPPNAARLDGPRKS